MPFTSVPLLRDRREKLELFPLISLLSLAPADAIDPLAFSIRRSRENLVAVACIDKKGFLGPCDFFHRGVFQEPPVKMWFSLARESNASAVMIAFRPTGGGGVGTEDDEDLVRVTRHFGKAIAIPVLAFIFVERNRVSVGTQAPEDLRRSVRLPVATRSR